MFFIRNPSSETFRETLKYVTGRKKKEKNLGRLKDGNDTKD